ncbi:hypothetical protein [Methylorubrum populi]|uniref:Uncharacterized protein n=1 Tax=Methylorubrum populi TaxID=223967 RepID=A0A833N2W4_9HYPH|nr:hypothetical protein [Methylorubrum populi]KAB7788008.1 hypothetical protein F8B43_0013 [Methylorubrum populi]
MIYLRSLFKRWQASRLRVRAEDLIKKAFGMKEEAKLLQVRANKLEKEADELEKQDRERA